MPRTRRVSALAAGGVDAELHATPQNLYVPGLIGEPPRIALIGCGRWGRRILDDLLSLGAQVWVVDPVSTPEAVVPVLPSIDQLPAVDGAIVATPATTHAAVAEDALRLGVPVFVEKPLTTDAAAAAQLAALGGDRLFVMDKWRYHPGVRELAGIARSGELGAVHSLHTRRVKWGHLHPDVDTVWNQLPHDLSIVNEVLGWLPPAQAAMAETSQGERVGLTATLGGPPWIHIEVSCVAPAPRHDLRLVCEKGVAHLDGAYSPHVTVGTDWHTGSTQLEQRPIDDELPLHAELRAFLEYLGGGQAPRSDARQGAAVVQRVAELGELARHADAALT